MLFAFLIFTALAALFYYIYQFGTKNENFFVERRLAFRKPVFIVGNSFKTLTKQMGVYDFIKGISKDYPKERYP